VILFRYSFEEKFVKTRILIVVGCVILTGGIICKNKSNTSFSYPCLDMRGKIAQHDARKPEIIGRIVNTEVTELYKGSYGAQQLGDFGPNSYTTCSFNYGSVIELKVEKTDDNFTVIRKESALEGPEENPILDGEVFVSEVTLAKGSAAHKTATTLFANYNYRPSSD
jgi:hypothetical protein